MKTYLIQRAKFENRYYEKGIDSILYFDYMGSSEFECGALPESLSKIRYSINDYVYLDVPIKGKVITVFCKDNQKSEVKKYLTELSENKWYLKEYSDFDNYINSKFMRSRTDFWWDISNHLMFWRKNNEFESNFKTIITKKPF
jgi:hypothetical protein